MSVTDVCESDWDEAAVAIPEELELGLVVAAADVAGAGVDEAAAEIVVDGAKLSEGLFAEDTAAAVDEAAVLADAPVPTCTFRGC